MVFISDGYLHPSGYRQVKICGQNYNVHRVVMLAFKGPPPNEQAWQVHHKDSDQINNRLDNLEYVTPSQNMLHAFARPIRRGGGHAIPVMWRRLGTEKWTLCTSALQAAQQLGLAPSTVSKACRTHVPTKGFEMQFQETSPSTLIGEEWRPMLDPASGDQVHKRMGEFLWPCDVPSRIDWQRVAFKGRLLSDKHYCQCLSKKACFCSSVGCTCISWATTMRSFNAGQPQRSGQDQQFC